MAIFLSIHYMCGLSLACRPAILDGFGQKIAGTMDSSPIGRDGGYMHDFLVDILDTIPSCRYQPLWTVTVGILWAIHQSIQATSPIGGDTLRVFDHLEIGDD